MKDKNVSKAKSKTQVFVPKGTVNPAEDTIIEIPGNLLGQPMIIAKRKDSRRIIGIDDSESRGNTTYRLDFSSNTYPTQVETRTPSLGTSLAETENIEKRTVLAQLDQYHQARRTYLLDASTAAAKQNMTSPCQQSGANASFLSTLLPKSNLSAPFFPPAATCSTGNMSSQYQQPAYVPPSYGVSIAVPQLPPLPSGAAGCAPLPSEADSMQYSRFFENTPARCSTITPAPSCQTCASTSSRNIKNTTATSTSDLKRENSDEPATLKLRKKSKTTETQTVKLTDQGKRAKEQEENNDEEDEEQEENENSTFEKDFQRENLNISNSSFFEPLKNPKPVDCSTCSELDNKEIAKAGRKSRSSLERSSNILTKEDLEEISRQFREAREKLVNIVSLASKSIISSSALASCVASRLSPSKQSRESTKSLWDCCPLDDKVDHRKVVSCSNMSTKTKLDEKPNLLTGNLKSSQENVRYKCSSRATNSESNRKLNEAEETLNQKTEQLRKMLLKISTNEVLDPVTVVRSCEASSKEREKNNNIYSTRFSCQKSILKPSHESAPESRCSRCKKPKPQIVQTMSNQIGTTGPKLTPEDPKYVESTADSDKLKSNESKKYVTVSTTVSILNENEPKAVDNVRSCYYNKNFPVISQSEKNITEIPRVKMKTVSSGTTE